jgi:DNA-binding beta-propeller fold protein YncE
MKHAGILPALALVGALAGAEYAYEGKWGSFGYLGGQFHNPEAITVSSTGYVYVADTRNDRVQYFTPTGGPAGSWGYYNYEGHGGFFNPSGIALAPNGRVYVTDQLRVQYFTPQGRFLGQWPVIGFPGLSGNPSDVAVAPNGNVYVCDEAEDCYIQYYTPTGSRLGR